MRAAGLKVHPARQKTVNRFWGGETHSPQSSAMKFRVKSGSLFVFEFGEEV